MISAWPLRPVPAKPRKAIEPDDVTLDAPSDPSSEGSQEVCRLRLRDATTTTVRSEVAHLLHNRLRSASLIIFCGLTLFLVWHILSFDRLDRAIELAAGVLGLCSPAEPDAASEPRLTQ